MTTLLEKIGDLNDLVLKGKALEAFDKYYHEDVVMQENESTPTIGKDENRRREEEFFSSISEFRNAKPGTNKLLALMFALFIIGLGLIVRANTKSEAPPPGPSVPKLELQ